MSLNDLISPDGKFLGIEWSFWKVVGWTGNLVFFSRFIVQWYFTEKHKKVVIPVGFWWLSLIGSLLLLIYGLSKRDSVFIFAYLFTWIPYIRNLMIHYRHQDMQVVCRCGIQSVSTAHFCHACGSRLASGEKDGFDDASKTSPHSASGSQTRSQ